MAEKWGEEMLVASTLSEAFRCCICRLLLKPPVMLTDKAGNVCNDCFRVIESPGDMNTIENLPVDNLLKIIKWPCDHCCLELQYDLWRDHNEFCRYRTLFCEIDECSWKGARKDYIVHFEKHKEEINTVRHKKDQFTLPQFEDHEVKSVILDTSIGKFVSHIFLDEHRLRISLLDIGYLPKTKKFDCYLQCSNASGNLLKYMCKVVESNMVLELPPDEQFTVLNLAFLRQFLGYSGKIKYKLVMSNIGDFICQSCHSKVVPNTRKTSNTRKTCSYLPFGCCIKLLSNKRDRHEEICHYKPYDCPVDCDILPIPFLKLVDHLAEKHSSVTFSNQCVFSSKVPNGLVRRLYMLGLNHIFTVKLREVDNETKFECCVTQIGPHENRFILCKADICKVNGSEKSFTCIGEFMCKHNEVTSSFHITENLSQVETLKLTILKLGGFL